MDRSEEEKLLVVKTPSYLTTVSGFDPSQDGIWSCPPKAVPARFPQPDLEQTAEDVAARGGRRLRRPPKRPPVKPSRTLKS